MLNYYGGKLDLRDFVISNFPKGYEQMLYVEPYIGGGSIWFYKNRSIREVINDINPNLITFYKMVKRDFKAVRDRADETLLTEKTFKHYKDIFHGKKNASDMEKALSVIFLCLYSFGGVLHNYTPIAGGSIDKHHSANNIYDVKFKRFLNSLNLYANHLQRCTIFNRDSLKVINYYNHERYNKPKFLEKFFYLDPPYPEAETSPYKVKKDDCRRHFQQLLATLKTLNGKFLLSCYVKPWMDLDPSWKIVTKKHHTTMPNYMATSDVTTNKPQKKLKSVKQRKKLNKRVECLIKNY